MNHVYVPCQTRPVSWPEGLRLDSHVIDLRARGRLEVNWHGTNSRPINSFPSETLELEQSLPDTDLVTVIEFDAVNAGLGREVIHEGAIP